MRYLERAFAALGAVIAVVLIVLAVDILAVSRDLSDDDFRFQSAPTRQRSLWNDLGLLPGSSTVQALGLEDDLSYRRTVALFVLAQPGRVSDTGPQVEAARGQAALELTRRSRAEPDSRRRSQLLNFLGLIPLARSLDDPEERSQVLRAAIGTFQSAVRVDPENADAKWNLEAVLRDFNYAGLPPNSPSGEAAGGQRSSPGGAVGSGY
ncbi:MAG: hypothetical protein H0U08_07955 [Actinobacteria bacterium]|nr:hypothetical protein [Actinomycetota bacterium]